MRETENEKVPGTSSKVSKGLEGTTLGKNNRYDKGLSVLEQYDLVSDNTYRGRGTLLCQTAQGLKMIQPYTGSVKRLEKINQILEHLQKMGHKNLDQILRNKEGNLTSVDADGYTYLVKNWFVGKECDVRSEREILLTMRRMAQVHKDLFLSLEDSCEKENLLEEYKKHNQQLKKIRIYIRKRKQKSLFDYRYLASVERYLDYGSQALLRLEQSDYKEICQQDSETGSICHGMCNQHNFLMLSDGTAMVNFDHFFAGGHMSDVAQFLRKIMEKYNWNLELAHKMLNSYDQIIPISKGEWKQLGIRMSYPEKYWKIANFYYNSNKAFQPEKNMEKLERFILQEKSWNDFLKTFFETFC